MRYSGSKLEKHATMCVAAEAALSDCLSKAGDAKPFPEACTDVAVDFLECAVAKREYAYETAAHIAGKDEVNKVLPKYEESIQKAKELIALYKDNAAGGKLKKDVFWG